MYVRLALCLLTWESYEKTLSCMSDDWCWLICPVLDINTSLSQLWIETYHFLSPFFLLFLIKIFILYILMIFFAFLQLLPDPFNLLTHPLLFLLLFLTISYTYILNLGHFHSLCSPIETPLSNKLPSTLMRCFIFLSTEFNYGCLSEHEWDCVLEFEQFISCYTTEENDSPCSTLINNP